MGIVNLSSFFVLSPLFISLILITLSRFRGDMLDVCICVCYYFLCVLTPKHINDKFKGRSALGLHIVQGVQFHMPIAITFVPSRRKMIAVDVVPAEWQLYIAH
jgi:hypothetical protein